MNPERVPCGVRIRCSHGRSTLRSRRTSPPPRPDCQRSPSPPTCPRPWHQGGGGDRSALPR
eukprot:11056348-Alexandrium_andersonii.AAC.1